MVHFTPESGGYALLFIITFLFGNTISLTATASPEVILWHPWAGISLLSLSLVGAIVVMANKKAPSMVQTFNISKFLIAAAVGHIWLHGTLEIQHVQGVLEWSDTIVDRVLSVWWIFISGAVMLWGFWKKKSGALTAALFLLALPFLKDLFLFLEGDAGFYEGILWAAITVFIAYVGVWKQQPRYTTLGLYALCAVAAADMWTSLEGSQDHKQSLVFLHTIWWTLVALGTIILGFALRNSFFRKIAIVLFGLAAFKLLVFDFSGLDTPVRIAATIATGLILIGASYLYQRFDSRLIEK